MSAHPSWRNLRAANTAYSRGVWEAQPRALCIIEGYYRVVLRKLMRSRSASYMHHVSFRVLCAENLTCMGALLWLNGETLERAPCNPLLNWNTFVRCYTHWRCLLTIFVALNSFFFCLFFCFVFFCFVFLSCAFVHSCLGFIQIFVVKRVGYIRTLSLNCRINLAFVYLCKRHSCKKVPYYKKRTINAKASWCKDNI